MAIPARTEMSVRSRTTAKNLCSISMIEDRAGKPPDVASLNGSSHDGKVVYWCFNSRKLPRKLRAWSRLYGKVKRFYWSRRRANRLGMGPSNTWTKDRLTPIEDTPNHLEALYEAASKRCTKPKEARKLASWPHGQIYTYTIIIITNNRQQYK